MNKKKSFIRIFLKWYGIFLLFLIHGGVIALLFLLSGYFGKNAEENAWKADCITREQERVEVPKDSIYADWEELSLRGYKVYAYDENGNQTGEYGYDAEGNLDRYRIREYDEWGNCTRKVSGDSYTREKTEWSCQYAYEEGGILRREASYRDGTLESVTDYRYQGENTVSATVYYDDKGLLTSGCGRIQDENGNELCSYNYDENGVATSWQYGKYDEIGRCVYRSIGRGETEDDPAKELIIEWEEDTHTSREILYEPIGHINAVQYNTYTESGNQQRGVRYFSGYSGHEESDWNLELQFTEGYWADYEGEYLLSEMQYAYQELSYYKFYLYDDAGNCTAEVSYNNDNDLHFAELFRYIYDADGKKCAAYNYRITENITCTRDDGSTTRLEFDADSHIASITRSGSDGTILQQYFFDDKGKMIGQYVPGLGPLWTEELPETAAGGTTETEDGTPETEDGLSDADVGMSHTYVVQKGDSLWKIAEAYYGDGRYYYEIYRWNWETIGPDMNFIPPGMELYLPEQESYGKN